MEKVPQENLDKIGTKARAVYMDVSHNIAAIEKVFSNVLKTHPDASIKAICGFGKLKDSKKMLQHLLSICSRINLVSNENFRLAKLEDMEKIAKECEEEGGKSGILQESEENGDTKKTLSKVLAESEESDVVVVCGSFFIMEDVRDFLGFDEPKDPKIVN